MNLGDWRNAKSELNIPKEKVKPLPGMKVKWKDVYFPFGDWINDAGDVVDITNGFRAEFGGIRLIVMMTPNTSAPGHGEPSMTANRPSFIDEDALEYCTTVNGNFITIK
ncbi:hypothetical protein M975_1896 [Buttiauxella brennerae ATCC 51605]|uniref:Uncharacterized protein n=1 Tax=Buttiauxella brennerae ATCC 51605 TaxID=1354251 RepID=A0A1B7IQI9_9ENTR|nr:hypothetical protein [Buttiauxella brennerae]OAT32004.1 hypothetical protein M975_1896 [Buttiauxella brennerae ATCC 51605]